MKIAVSDSSLHNLFSRGELTIVSFLKYAASLGVAGVELSDSHFQSNYTKLDEILEVLEETKLEVACYSLDACYPNSLRLQEAITVGLKLKSVCICFKDTLQVLEAANLLKHEEVVLCLENSPAGRGKSFAVADFLEDLNNPQIKSMFHVANFFLAGELPQQAYQRLKRFVGYVRACDVRLADPDEETSSIQGADGRYYVGSVVGLGMVQVSDLIHMLINQEYRGWIAIDFKGLEDSRFGVEASLLNLRQCLQSYN